ncbi:MAG: enoyl-[acyl-carrier-protein] reductase FabV, partial [Erysipelotrichales bacterium]
LNAHPLGCEQNIINQINNVKELYILNIEPLNVLIIGGSSGYGLASRILLAYNNAFIYNVSFENGPSKRLSGSAGYFNNYYFNKHFPTHKDLNIDCFSNEAKVKVIEYFKEHNKKIDLIIYSVASGVRIDPTTNKKYSSTLKPINQYYNGKIIDVAKEVSKDVSLQPATTDEIESTIKVMGGEDYLLWIDALDNAGILNDRVKAVSYTYLGSPLTYPIYKDGTIGLAKKDLKKKSDKINMILNKYNGNAYVCSAKSIVTKASIFIPTVPLYVSALDTIMHKNNTYETIVEHIHRLYYEMIYGDNPIYDNDGILRIDNYELEPSLQKEIKEILNSITNENFKEKVDFKQFKKDFLNINGFSFENIDYDKDINLDIYQ